MKRLSLALVACSLLGVVACSSEETPTVGEPPSVSITMPSDGSEVTAGKVTVVASVANFEVVNKLGQDPVPGEGHIHFYIDVKEIPTTPNKPAITDDAKTYHAVATKSFTWDDVKPGKHRFAVQLVNNNHTPLSTAVTDEVTVTVK
jgi:uncharacterized protein DUF4399